MMRKSLRHIPNAVTLLRPVLACVFIALLPDRFAGGSAIAPMIVFALICLTDFVDGRLARAWGAVTETGAYLDLMSDFLYIAASLVALNLLREAPVWFTAAVCAKFLEYLVTSHILRRGAEGPVFITDPCGRIAAGMFFAVPGVVCGLHGAPGGDILCCGVLYLAACLALLSSVARCAACSRLMKKGSVFN